MTTIVQKPQVLSGKNCVIADNKTMRQTSTILSLILIAAIGTSVAGPPATTSKTNAPEPGTPRKAEFKITVPLIYDGRQIGTTGIPMGDTIRVIRETPSNLTIWHMGHEVTVAKTGAGQTANSAPITDGVTIPATAPYPGTASQRYMVSGDGKFWVKYVVNTYTLPDNTTTAEFMNMVKQRDPKVAAYLNMLDMQKRYAKPGTVTLADTFCELPPPATVPETISLRPEFEKLGIQALDQKHEPLCEIYAAYQMLRFTFAKKHMKPPVSLEAFKKLASSGSGLEHIRRANISKLIIRTCACQTSSITMASTWSGEKANINIEWVKYELKHGRPVVISARAEGSGNPHAMVAVGIHTFPNPNSFQDVTILNSWGTDWKDKGYGITGINGGAEPYSLELQD